MTPFSTASMDFPPTPKTFHAAKLAAKPASQVAATTGVTSIVLLIVGINPLKVKLVIPKLLKFKNFLLSILIYYSIYIIKIRTMSLF